MGLTRHFKECDERIKNVMKGGKNAMKGGKNAMKGSKNVMKERML